MTVPAKPFAYQYPRPAVTVDIILFVFQQDQLRVLLIRRANDPYKGKWALPGGFVGEQENLYDAALRELKEETNVSNVYLEQLYTFGEPGRDPRARVITVAYFALLSAEEVAQQEVHGASDAGEARWWDIYDLPELAFDHQKILDYALQRLRWKLEWTAPSSTRPSPPTASPPATAPATGSPSGATRSRAPTWSSTSSSASSSSTR